MGWMGTFESKTSLGGQIGTARRRGVGGWGLGEGAGPHLQLSAPRTPLCICSQVSLECGVHLSGGTYPMKVGQGYIFPGPSDTCWASEGVPQ